MFDDVSDSGRVFESQPRKDLLRLRKEKVGWRTSTFGEGGNSGGDEGGEDSSEGSEESSDSSESAPDGDVPTSRGSGLEDAVSEDAFSSALVFAGPDFKESLSWPGSSSWRRCWLKWCSIAVPLSSMHTRLWGR